ncbi:MAG: P1 family peptidase, partial [Actinoplanes sp.]
IESHEGPFVPMPAHDAGEEGPLRMSLVESGGRRHPTAELRRLMGPTWRFAPGAANGITDVAGVTVGHSTLLDPEQSTCTGVTVVQPCPGVVHHPVPAAVHVINGYGKSVGLMQIEELGELESPIALTGVFGIPDVLRALVDHLLVEDPDLGSEKSGRSVNAVVMECNDSRMHDPRVTQPGAAELAEAIRGAGAGPVPQGPVGAGVGMSTFGFAGGIGTASRVVPLDGSAYHVGALVLTNFGRRDDLVIAGRPVGQLLPQPVPVGSLGGSVIVILATDLPTGSAQLKRLARRAQNGLARTGCSTSGSSGEVVLAFSTARGADLAREPLDWAFAAVAESVEEAVLNSLCHSVQVRGRAGRSREPFPADRLPELLRAAGPAVVGSER